MANNCSHSQKTCYAPTTFAENPEIGIVSSRHKQSLNRLQIEQTFKAARVWGIHFKEHFPVSFVNLKQYITMPTGMSHLVLHCIFLTVLIHENTLLNWTYVDNLWNFHTYFFRTINQTWYPTICRWNLKYRCIFQNSHCANMQMPSIH